MATGHGAGVFLRHPFNELVHRVMIRAMSEPDNKPTGFFYGPGAQVEPLVPAAATDETALTPAAEPAAGAPEPAAPAESAAFPEPLGQAARPAQGERPALAARGPPPQP